MIVLILTLGGFLLYLIYERISLDIIRQKIPLIISVTGTRGKSSVVRLLASVLREGGRRVLAKSTGSRAQYLLPDGRIEDISRRGVVSILEQKSVLRKAASLGVDCLVVEIMSVHPENHFNESAKIVKPHNVLLTNIRRDHTAAMGESEGEIAQVLALDLVAGSQVFLSSESLKLIQSTGTTPSNIQYAVVTPGLSRQVDFAKSADEALTGNYDLVVAAARSMRVADDVIARGLARAVQDVGEFRIWKYKVEGKELFTVNAFAANDPESTRALLNATRQRLAHENLKYAGLLNLRRDRADRTLQWIEALSAGDHLDFDSLFVLGGHSHAAAKRIEGMSVVTSRGPEKIMQTLALQVSDRSVIFGFGNIGEAGTQLVEHWKELGEPYGN